MSFCGNTTVFEPAPLQLRLLVWFGRRIFYYIFGYVYRWIVLKGIVTATSETSEEITGELSFFRSGSSLFKLCDGLTDLLSDVGPNMTQLSHA